MALSNKFHRLALLMEPDVQRMLDKHAQRIAGHDGARFDDLRGVVSYQRQGALLWQPRAEKIGEWSNELALFRWYWYGVKWGEHQHRRLDVVHREGENYGLVELTTDSVNADDEREAGLLAHLAAQLARADGVLRVPQSDRVVFYALYDGKPSEAPRGEILRDTAVNSGSQRPAWMTTDPLDAPHEKVMSFTPAAVGAVKGFSVAPPPQHNPQTSLRPGGSRTMPPIKPIDVLPDDRFDDIPAIPAPPPAARVSPPAALPQLPIREPKRELFMPVAQTALGDIATSVPGFAQALLVVRVETSQGKGRFFVQLVALDHEGDLIALDPSRALLDAAAKMIGDDARDGNGRWAKLAARLKPTERGASVEMDIA
jgi:hypothetical protein